jgi:predicted amidophosphoribosyltransferase
VLDLVLPQRCLVCGADGTLLCSGCREALPQLEPPLCARCGAPTAWPVHRCRECSGRRLAFASARAAVPYDDAVRRVVGGWKERGLRRLAEEAAELVAERVARPEAALLAYVPSGRGRRRRRGHHPAERLARALAPRWGMTCVPLLERTRDGARQRGLPLAERRRNVAGAFTALQGINGPVVLVDDVYTTGATASAASASLRAAGASRVDVVTFARAIRTRGYRLG